jgi:predicted HTH domain antitoxin
MRIFLNLPDSLSQTETCNQSDWLRETALALFQPARICLICGSKIAEVKSWNVKTRWQIRIFVFIMI